MRGNTDFFLEMDDPNFISGIDGSNPIPVNKYQYQKPKSRVKKPKLRKASCSGFTSLRIRMPMPVQTNPAVFNYIAWLGFSVCSPLRIHDDFADVNFIGPPTPATNEVRAALNNLVDMGILLEFNLDTS